MERLSLQEQFLQSSRPVSNIGHLYFNEYGKPVENEALQTGGLNAICINTIPTNPPKQIVDIELQDAFYMGGDYPGCRICWYREGCKVAEKCSKLDDFASLKVDLIEQDDPNFSWTTLKPCAILSGCNCIRRTLEEGICTPKEIKELFPTLNKRLAYQSGAIGTELYNLISDYYRNNLPKNFSSSKRNTLDKLITASFINLPAPIADAIGFINSDDLGESLSLKPNEIPTFPEKLLPKTHISGRLTLGIHRLLDRINIGKVDNLISALEQKRYGLYRDVDTNKEIQQTAKRSNRLGYLLTVVSEMINDKNGKGCLRWEGNKRERGRSKISEKNLVQVHQLRNIGLPYIINPKDLTPAMIFPNARIKNIKTSFKPGCSECPLNSSCGALELYHYRIQVRIADFFRAKTQESYYRILQILDE